MTFNEGADLGGDRVRKRSRGATAGIAVGGVGIGAVVIALVSAFLGVDVSGLVGAVTGQGQTTGSTETGLAGCDTGADANDRVECRMEGAALSLDAYWQGIDENVPAPDVVLFEDSTSTGCGTGTSAMGPFYCPADATIYLDVAFFDELESTFGTSGGPLAQMYVLAHEYGHHIENLQGVMSGLDLQATGAASDSVRLELMADCYAGSWVAAAASTVSDNGEAFLQAPTRAELEDALSAAAAVGDDHIQETLGGGQVRPDSWTHGSSQQRVEWFARGYDQGWQVCGTALSVAAAEL